MSDVETQIVPWRAHPPGPPPLVERAAGDHDGLNLTDAVLAFLGDGRLRARLAEVDGALCATLVGARFESTDAVPALERIDLVLRPSAVLMFRTRVTGSCAALDAERIRAQWDQTPQDQRDTSVLFVQIIDAIVDCPVRSSTRCVAGSEAWRSGCSRRTRR